MADDGEKTEEPTAKKIEDARKQGNVPKSQDASGVITLFVAILAILMLFNSLALITIILFFNISIVHARSRAPAWSCLVATKITRRKRTKAKRTRRTKKINLFILL